MAVRFCEPDKLVLLDQRRLPHHIDHVTCSNYGDVVTAIKDMVVRGAPAIGAAAGYGLAIAAIQSTATDWMQFESELETARCHLYESRPTAVNLKWALDRMMRLVEEKRNKISLEEMKSALLAEANGICEDDVRINKTMAGHGAALVPHGAKILHHCNTGALATVDWGTALGVIHTAHDQGKNIHVWVDETRPRLQGAKLTAWELMQWGVPFKLIPDNAAGLLMQRGQVDMILVGADRIAMNGDTANKIGTYKLAACAKDCNVPFYIVAPISTIDLDTLNGDAIPIEERDSKEVTHIGHEVIAPEGCPVFNPAFDITPARLITGIITEKGIARPPYAQSLKALFEN